MVSTKGNRINPQENQFREIFSILKKIYGKVSILNGKAVLDGWCPLEKKSLWWNHGASTLGQATVWDTFVLYSNSLAINGKIYIHQLKNKIFGRYQPDSPWLIMVFLWFSHGFLGPWPLVPPTWCRTRWLLGASPGRAALFRSVLGVPGTALAVLGGQEETGKWGRRNGVIGWGDPTMWGPQSIAFSWFITPISMVYGIYNYSYWGL